MISKIYKFRSVNTNNLTALSSCHLWFSSLPDFNDPFEGEYAINETLSSEDEAFLIEKVTLISQGVDPDSNNYYNTLERLDVDPESDTLMTDLGIAFAKDDIHNLLKILHNSKCISFSAKTNQHDPLYENLLWAHYADGLRGYCLVFDYKKLSEYFYHSIKEAIRPIQVSYQKKPKELLISNFIRSKSFHNDTDISYIQTLTETMATKSSSWSYENELRYISLKGQNVYTYPPECLKSIIIGEKMSEDQIKLLKKVALSVHPNISIKYATIEKNTYTIKIVNALHNKAISADAKSRAAE